MFKTIKVKSGLEIPKAKDDSPVLAEDCDESKDLECTKSGRSGVDPTQHCPDGEEVTPMQAKLCMKSEKSKWKESRTINKDSVQDKPIEKDGRPIQAELCSGGDNSRCKKSRVDNSDLEQVKNLIGITGSKAPRSNATVDDSNLVVPKVTKAESRHASNFKDGKLSRCK